MDSVQSSTATTPAGAAHARCDDLFARVYDELHSIAHREMRRERPGHVLQTTALVDEAYVRLARGAGAPCDDRPRFLAAAATAMRRILVDDARQRSAVKRDHEERGAGLDVAIAAGARPDDGDAVDVEALHVALERFATDERHRAKLRVVELRYFAGLALEEVADVLGVSLATVKRDWEFSRAWLYREIARMSHAR